MLSESADQRGMECPVEGVVLDSNTPMAHLPKSLEELNGRTENWIGPFAMHQGAGSRMSMAVSHPPCDAVTRAIDRSLTKQLVTGPALLAKLLGPPVLLTLFLTVWGPVVTVAAQERGSLGTHDQPPSLRPRESLEGFGEAVNLVPLLLLAGHPRHLGPSLHQIASRGGRRKQRRTWSKDRQVRGEQSRCKSKHTSTGSSNLQSRLFCSLRIGWVVEAVGGAKLLRAATKRQRLDGESEKCRVGCPSDGCWLARRLSLSSFGNWPVHTSLARCQFA